MESIVEKNKEEENSAVNNFSSSSSSCRYGRRNISSIEKVVLPSPKTRSLMKRELYNNLKDGVLKDTIESIKKVKEELYQMQCEAENLSQEMYLHELKLTKCLNSMIEIEEKLEGTNNDEQDSFPTPSSSVPLEEHEYELLLDIESGIKNTVKCPTESDKVSALERRG